MKTPEKPSLSSHTALPGDEVSVDEALELGAFPEDALSEQDALEAESSPRLPPAEALAPRRN
jgi:hypothetical protein